MDKAKKLRTVSTNRYVETKISNQGVLEDKIGRSEKKHSSFHQNL